MATCSRARCCLHPQGYLSPSSPSSPFRHPCCAAPDLVAANPYNGTHGCDWVREASSPSLDFACIHAYPDQWRPGCDPAAAGDWMCGWVQAHLAAAASHLGGKAVMLQEFGWRPGGAERAALYQKVGVRRMSVRQGSGRSRTEWGNELESGLNGGMCRCGPVGLLQQH